MHQRPSLLLCAGVREDIFLLRPLQITEFGAIHSCLSLLPHACPLPWDNDALGLSCAQAPVSVCSHPLYLQLTCSWSCLLFCSRSKQEESLLMERLHKHSVRTDPRPGRSLSWLWCRGLEAFKPHSTDPGCAVNSAPAHLAAESCVQAAGWLCSSSSLPSHFMLLLSQHCQVPAGHVCDLLQ